MPENENVLTLCSVHGPTFAECTPGWHRHRKFAAFDALLLHARGLSLDHEEHVREALESLVAAMPTRPDLR